MLYIFSPCLNQYIYVIGRKLWCYEQFQLFCCLKTDEAVVIIVFLIILIKKPDSFLGMSDICIGMCKIAAVLTYDLLYFLIFCQRDCLLPVFISSAALQTYPQLSRKSIHRKQQRLSFLFVYTQQEIVAQGFICILFLHSSILSSIP